MGSARSCRSSTFQFALILAEVADQHSGPYPVIALPSGLRLHLLQSGISTLHLTPQLCLPPRSPAPTCDTQASQHQRQWRNLL